MSDMMHAMCGGCGYFEEIFENLDTYSSRNSGNNLCNSPYVEDFTYGARANFIQTAK